LLEVMSNLGKPNLSPMPEYSGFMRVDGFLTAR